MRIRVKIIIKIDIRNCIRGNVTNYLFHLSFSSSLPNTDSTDILRFPLSGWLAGWLVACSCGRYCIIRVRFALCDCHNSKCKVFNVDYYAIESWPMMRWACEKLCALCADFRIDWLQFISFIGPIASHSTHGYAAVSHFSSNRKRTKPTKWSPSNENYRIRKWKGKKETISLFHCRLPLSFKSSFARRWSKAHGKWCSTAYTHTQPRYGSDVRQPVVGRESRNQYANELADDRKETF